MLAEGPVPRQDGATLVLQLGIRAKFEFAQDNRGGTAAGVTGDQGEVGPGPVRVIRGGGGERAEGIGGRGEWVRWWAGDRKAAGDIGKEVKGAGGPVSDVSLCDSVAGGAEEGRLGQGAAGQVVSEDNETFDVRVGASAQHMPLAVGQPTQGAQIRRRLPEENRTFLVMDATAAVPECQTAGGPRDTRGGEEVVAGGVRRA